MITTHRRPSGFTLIELMVVVAIIGILASVAMPTMQRMQLRAKAAERPTILDALARGAGDTISANQMLPDPADRTVWLGVDNPPGVPSTSKRQFDYSLPGWTFMPIIVQGSCYYSYGFTARDPGGAPASLVVNAQGDLDGDGNLTLKVIHYTSKGYSFYKDPTIPEFPLPGAEDEVTFGSF